VVALRTWSLKAKSCAELAHSSKKYFVRLLAHAVDRWKHRALSRAFRTFILCRVVSSAHGSASRRILNILKKMRHTRLLRGFRKLQHVAEISFLEKSHEQAKTKLRLRCNDLANDQAKLARSIDADRRESAKLNAKMKAHSLRILLRTCDRWKKRSLARAFGNFVAMIQTSRSRTIQLRRCLRAMLRKQVARAFRKWSARPYSPSSNSSASKLLLHHITRVVERACVRWRKRSLFLAFEAIRGRARSASKRDMRKIVPKEFVKWVTRRTSASTELSKIPPFRAADENLADRLRAENEALKLQLQCVNKRNADQSRTISELGSSMMSKRFDSSIKLLQEEQLRRRELLSTQAQVLRSRLDAHSRMLQFTKNTCRALGTDRLERVSRASPLKLLEKKIEALRER